MKKVEAIIRSEKFEEIREALSSHNIKGLTVSQVMGCGNQKGKKNFYRGTVVELSLLPKTKIEVVTEDEYVSDIVKLIAEVAKTGAIGDGKIFVYNIEEVVRIRTGESGDDAI
ncbi:MAG: P-II family nitrogen regulator [Clostridia bacterium]|nr:P-II family nitrogen regulator [Clostridia bacterium]MDR3645887.1 P-II family nitrogen regulator [Clostridia bacterium]